MREFDNCMLHILVHILSISEMRWKGSDKITKEVKTILCSGNEEIHINGVRMTLKGKSLMGWKPVNDTILTARFKSCHSKTTIIQVYAPMEKAEEEEEKDDFYNSLQDTLNEISKHGIKILMGDMNTKISRNRADFEQMIEPFSSASHNSNNDERLILFCSINGLCIGNSCFRYKMIRKCTWRYPGGHTENEIDYFRISQRWRSAL